MYSLGLKIGGRKKKDKKWSERQVYKDLKQLKRKIDKRHVNLAIHALWAGPFCDFVL